MEETGEKLAPARCICIGKQTAAGSLWLARKMNKIMKKKGKFRVEMQKSSGGRTGRPRTVSRLTAGGWNVAEERAHEGLCCAIFARRVQIVGEKIPRLLFLSMFLAAHRPRGSFSSTDTSVSERELGRVRKLRRIKLNW